MPPVARLPSSLDHWLGKMRNGLGQTWPVDGPRPTAPTSASQPPPIPPSPDTTTGILNQARPPSPLQTSPLRRSPQRTRGPDVAADRTKTPPEEDDAPLPLIVSDLAPSIPAMPPIPGPARPERAATPPPKTLGDGRTETTVPLPTTPAAARLLPVTPSRGVLTVLLPSRTPMSVLPSASPVVAVGRRTNSVSHGANFFIRGGRPKGWKPGMSYKEVALRNLGLDEAAVAAAVLLTPRKTAKKTRPPTSGATDDGRIRRRRRQAGAGSGTPNYVLKRHGRAPQPTIEAMQRAIYLKSIATFRPFRCEWAGCRAELHNMATLRRHVAVVHGQATACCWRTCVERAGKDGRTSDGKTLMEHVAYQHLAPIEWHQGDGFANSGHIGPPARPWLGPGPDDGNTDAGESYKSTLPRYLLDDEGRQITPRIQDVLLQPAARSAAETTRRLEDMYREQQRGRA